MSRKEITTYEVICDRCGARIPEKEEFSRVIGLNFSIMDKKSGLNFKDDRTYQDLCEICSIKILKFSSNEDVIEMNRKQYDSFKNWRFHTPGWFLTNCAEWAREDKIPSDKAMLAWLYPKEIKVIGE